MSPIFDTLLFVRQVLKSLMRIFLTLLPPSLMVSISRLTVPAVLPLAKSFVTYSCSVLYSRMSRGFSVSFSRHPLSSPHEKSAKPFSSSTPPNPKALMVFQLYFSKPVLLNLPLFLTNYSSFPTIFAHFPPMETSQRLSYPKKRRQV